MSSTFLTNALGSTIALTDGTGTVQTEYTYDPFGMVTVTGTGSTNSYQFTGREHDGTGLLYYRARYYSPVIQRFISEDPIGFAGGDPNLYAYVFNNPVKLTDPEGENPLTNGGGPGFIVGGFVGFFEESLGFEIPYLPTTPYSPFGLGLTAGHDFVKGVNGDKDPKQNNFPECL